MEYQESVWGVIIPSIYGGYHIRKIMLLSCKDYSGHRTGISGHHIVIWWLSYERYSGCHTGNMSVIIQEI